MAQPHSHHCPHCSQQSTTCVICSISREEVTSKSLLSSIYRWSAFRLPFPMVSHKNHFRDNIFSVSIKLLLSSNRHGKSNFIVCTAGARSNSGAAWGAKFECFKIRKKREEIKFVSKLLFPEHQSSVEEGEGLFGGQTAPS